MDAAVDAAVAATAPDAGRKPPPATDAGHPAVCQEAQGYLFGRPVSAEEFEKLLVTGGSLRPAKPALP